jgi:hypothetical protein
VWSRSRNDKTPIQSSLQPPLPGMSAIRDPCLSAHFSAPATALLLRTIAIRARIEKRVRNFNT